LIPGSDQTLSNEHLNHNEGDVQNGLPQDEMPPDNRSFVNDVGGGDDFGHDDLEEVNNANVTFGKFFELLFLPPR